MGLLIWENGNVFYENLKAVAELKKLLKFKTAFSELFLRENKLVYFGESQIRDT